MRSRQSGITFIGWLFLLAPVAIVGYTAIRLTPVYLNYMKVAKVLKQTADENAGGGASNATTLRASLGKRFDIESITFPDYKDVEIKREGQAWVMSVNYDDIVPLLGGISLQVHFEKRAVVE